MASPEYLYYPFRRLTQSFRALPNSIIIGAQKAGTSHIFQMLARHPEVSVSFRPEGHFFDSRFGRGIGWYRSWFPVSWKTKKAVLEKTPFYLFHPRCAERIHATLPAVRLIAILRNPVSRAYSAYQHQVRGGKEPLSFKDALAKEVERTAEERNCFDDVNHPLKAMRRFTYRERGIYHEQLARYLALFPRESLLVLCSEKLFADPKTQHARMCRHLGIAETDPPTLPPSNSGGEYTPIDRQVAEELKAFYAPHNQRLYEMVGEDFGW